MSYTLFREAVFSLCLRLFGWRGVWVFWFLWRGWFLHLHWVFFWSLVLFLVCFGCYWQSVIGWR